MHSRAEDRAQQVAEVQGCFRGGLRPRHLVGDKPLHMMPGDITHGLVTKHWEQVVSYEVSVVMLRRKLQCGQDGGLPLRADELAELHRRLRVLQRGIDVMEARFEQCAGLPFSGEVRERADDLRTTDAFQSPIRRELCLKRVLLVRLCLVSLVRPICPNRRLAVPHTC
jgi:hypothetical protein